MPERLPASCIKSRPVHTFTAQNTEFPGRSSVWLEFTASGDKPHAPMVFLSRHSRESGNPLQSRSSLDSRFRGMTGFCEACLRLDREEERAFVCATIGYTMMTGFLHSAATMRTGVGRSVSFEMTAAASNSSFQASFRRWAARFTSEPYSSMTWNSAITASGSKADALRRLFRPAPRAG